MTQRWPKTSLALIFGLILVATSSCGSSTTSEISSDLEAPTSTHNQAQLVREGIQEQPPASEEQFGLPVNSADDSNLEGSQTDPEASEEQTDPETPEEQTAQGDSENPETPAAPENPADASNAGDLQLDGETPEEQTAQGDSENLETPAASENPADISEADFITSEASDRPLIILRLLLIFVWCGSVSVALAWILFLQNRRSKQLMEKIDERFNHLERIYLPDELRQLKSKVSNSSSDQTGIITQNDDVLKVEQNQILKAIDDLRDQLSQVNAKLEKYPNEQSKEHNFNNAADSSSTSSTILDSAVPEWVTDYNLLTLGGPRAKVDNFLTTNNVQEVTQTEQSFNQQWIGQKENIYFEVNTTTGSYWLIRSFKQQTPVYHIVPNKRKFSFLEGTLSAMEAYYDLKQSGADESQEFDPSKIKNIKQFQVIRPTEVEEVVPDQQWQLKEKGLLEF